MIRVPFAYHVRSLFRRWGATALTVAAIGLSVAVLVAMLALAAGFRASLAGTGRADNLIVLRKGATSEGESGFARDKAQVIANAPGLARDQKGQAMASFELYAATSLDKEQGGTTNIPLRGMSKAGIAVQSTATLGEGRWFEPGTREVVVGRGLVGHVKGCRLGGAIPFNAKDWPVVGIIDAKGQAWQSEIWGDVELLVSEFDRDGYNSVVVRAGDPGQIPALIERLEQDPRLQCKAEVQIDYYRRQTGALGIALQFVAWFLATITAIGAAFGATNTLLASLQGRRREIGSLLAIGFRPGDVCLGFLLEATLLGILGAVVGISIAWPLVNGLGANTTNWATFTEQTFEFLVTGDVIVTALVFGAFVGLVGGTIPAWRASRLPPTEALRAL